MSTNGHPDLHVAPRSPLQAGGGWRWRAVLPAVEVVQASSLRSELPEASDGWIEIVNGSIDADALWRVVRVLANCLSPSSTRVRPTCARGSRGLRCRPIGCARWIRIVAMFHKPRKPPE